MIDKYLVRRWDIYRWYRIFRELGMEFIESQLPDMGLEALPNVAAVREVARHFLEQYQKRIGDEADDEALMRDTFARIAQVTSEETAAALYRWAVESFQWEISRWHTIFSLLSMERVEPFLPEMGLNLPNVAGVREVARRSLEQYTKRMGDEIEDEALMQETFAQIAQVTGEETAEDMYRWGLQQFPWGGPDSAREFTWNYLLRRLVDSIEGEENASAPPALPESKARAIIEIVRAYLADTDVLQDRIAEAEQQPKSEWEERVYQEYKIENIPEISPLDGVSVAIEFHHFHKTWDRIKSLLTAEDMEILLQWSKSETERGNIPVSLVEFPPNPGIS